ncbi:hypothetical protein EDC01DRAFT_645966 [Geopyxis carbonaria]|nr:hypothetical protein EDC01DRAFT_645966 [Geopyxis carbonaria]
MRVLLPRRLYSTTTTTPPPNPLLTRALPPIVDWLSPTPSHLLSLSLSPYLHTAHPRTLPAAPRELPPGHHTVYFPPSLPESLLLRDGSDAEQSPGHPWTRRMWAGGSVAFSPHHRLKLFDRAALAERVESIEMKGPPGGQDEKMFVTFERRMWSAPGNEGELAMVAGEEAVVERRSLVFMKDRTAAPAVARVVKPPREPEFKHTFTPTQHLLFRFSALTFNAHKIHYDSMFSREQERYPGNLCHGPLALVLLLEMVRKEVLKATQGGARKRVKRFDYRCLAPMYVDEPYTIAGRRTAEDRVEVWAETPAGGYSVRGVVELENELET